MHPHRLVHVDDVPPAATNPKEGWAMTAFRLPISGKDGSSTTVFHARLAPGAAHKKHYHTACDEVLYYLKGIGVAGAGEGRIELREGSFRLCPSGVEHWGTNLGQGGVTESVGFYIGARSVEETGYVYTGELTEEDVSGPARPCAYPFGRLGDVPAERLDEPEGWNFELRLLLSSRERWTSTLFHASFLPGAGHGRHHHRYCDEIYFVIKGNGIVGVGEERDEIRAGHVHYIPAGSEHWIRNTAQAEPLEIVGVYPGAGDIKATGYIYQGM